MIIIGHRGARGEAPENTPGAFEFALDKGVTHFELDLRLSADGIPMVIHDATTKRTCGAKLSVEQTGAAELCALDAASTDNWHRREPVPSLEHLLPLLERSESVQLEIKSDRPARLDKLIRATRQLLCHCDTQRYTFTSFDKRALGLAKQMAPGFRRGLVSDKRFVDNIASARRLGCSLLVYHYKVLSQRQISRAQESGLEVSCYTVNDLAEIKKLRGWDIDSVITDHPVRFLHLQK